jgi:hypothetical protein
VTAYIAKFAVLGIPAIVALFWWRHAGVQSKGLYTSSWANVASYVLWLGVAIMANRTSTFESLIIGFLIGIPLFAVGLSLVLAIWSGFVRQGERGTMAAANLSMLVLWAISVIAPN